MRVEGPVSVSLSGIESAEFTINMEEMSVEDAEYYLRMLEILPERLECVIQEAKAHVYKQIREQEQSNHGTRKGGA